ncbi:DoxX family protein [Flavobacterium cyanobacteriorum]|uniref:DoxX family protein n=1 Tax=Flavobacterium cyanobacteriorum TaxID=2022802 RepID=A0A255ZNR2_9FLAO|nr:DoxX family protein [Flavobacterium cyanobacteriorum]OYQ43039.1 DoxX family protein [Flavobacterium cyanobacteriorum]
MKNIFLWIMRLTAALILLQTLFFKFTGAEESVYIFTTLGAEPYGRIGSGIIELIASLLILLPRTTFYGALLGAGTMSGAILSHIFVLGLEVQGDGGQLFILALVTFACCLILMYLTKQKIYYIKQKI